MRTTAPPDPQRSRVYTWERHHVQPHDELALRGPMPWLADFITCPALRRCVDLRDMHAVHYDDLTKQEHARFRRALHAWEDSQYSPELGYLTLGQISELASRCLKRWHAGTSVNVDATGASCAHANAHHMSFPRWARRRSVVLHEIAHVISDRLWDTYSHGPEFMAVYIDLLHTYMGLSKRDLRNTAAIFRLDIQPGAYCYGGTHPRTVTIDWE